MKVKKKYTKKPMFSVEPENVKKAVSVGDLRDLVFWVLSDQHGPPAPQWLIVQNRSAIKRMISIMIPGLERPYGENELNDFKPRAFKIDGLPILDYFRHVWPTKAPGSKNRLDSAISEFTRIPLTPAEKKELEKKRQKTGLKATYETLLMTPEQLKEYPVAKDDSWIELDELDRDPKIFALDCEMVEVGLKSELARISIIGQDEQVVYESFVKPAGTITNYVTAYSGITPEILKDVTTTLEHVQQWLKENLSRSDTLLGHSLDFDLNVLHLVHKKIIDTALIYQSPRGTAWKPSLKWLAKRYLGIDIQTGNDGHDSAEDARTCMQLVAKKIEKGLNYGIQEHTTGIVEKLKESAQSTAIVDYGAPRWDQGHAKTVCSITSDSEAARKAAALTKSHNFVYVRLRELESAVGWYKDSVDIDMSKVYQELNANIKTILDAVEPNTAVLIWSGQSDPREMNRLLQKKRQWNEEYKTKKWDDIEDPWTEEHEKNLGSAVNSARMGIAFLEILKPETPEVDGPAPKRQKKN
ncbi:hypothetical protein B9G98_00679 [Wickerhamiella sorbophila]|uniref:RNA exonuclease 3 n=1 Tax=Wickerhamiella sorbophila TaxID=45607 RepID=A0A2T0FDP7_9ASCO|nr:hypothetical protein B9G98_00679 [Wickerhamiella sorbophila]PRT53059.1 hypothetical protein B9G98_00679 [Wickerhamiella sorbophila]